MAQDKPQDAVAFTSFGGLVTNGDPRDIGLSAQVLENLVLTVPGMLISRKGHGAAVFSNAQAAGTGDVIGMYRFETPSARWAIHQTDDGAIRVGKDAS